MANGDQWDNAGSFLQDIFGDDDVSLDDVYGVGLSYDDGNWSIGITTDEGWEYTMELGEDLPDWIWDDLYYWADEYDWEWDIDYGED